MSPLRLASWFLVSALVCTTGCSTFSSMTSWRPCRNGTSVGGGECCDPCMQHQGFFGGGAPVVDGPMLTAPPPSAPLLPAPTPMTSPGPASVAPQPMPPRIVPIPEATRTPYTP